MNCRRLARVLASFARRIGWGRNALRRPVDRVESAAAHSAILLALVAVPFALLAGTAVHRHNLSVSAAEMAGRQQVTAVLLQDVPLSVAAEGTASVPAAARWHLADGAEHTGIVRASPGLVVGTPVPIWVDSAGQQVAEPMTPDLAYWLGVVTVIGTMVVVIALEATALGILHWHLNRVRFSAWDAEWKQIGPRWTQRAG